MFWYFLRSTYSINKLVKKLGYYVPHGIARVWILYHPEQLGSVMNIKLSVKMYVVSKRISLMFIKWLY